MCARMCISHTYTVSVKFLSFKVISLSQLNNVRLIVSLIRYKKKVIYLYISFNFMFSFIFHFFITFDGSEKN